jgi:hypothetical protein
LYFAQASIRGWMSFGSTVNALFMRDILDQ